MVRIWQPDWRDRLAQIRVDATEAQSTQFRFVPFAPTMFEATPLTGTSVKLSWVPGGDGGSDITGYQVRRRVSGQAWGLWTDLVGADEDTDTVNVTGLKVSTLYSFQIRAENSNGVGAASKTSDVTTTGPPGKPAAVAVSTVDGQPTRLRVAWTVGTDGGSAITSWQYQIGTADPVTVAGGGAVSTVTLTGLSPGTVYKVRVRAVNANGDGEWSDQGSATTLAGLPGPPGSLVVSKREANALTVTWTAAAGAAGFPVTSYEVSLDEGTWTDVGDVLTYRVTGLNVGTQYSLQVRAVNANGSGPSEIVGGLTLATAGALVGLSAVAGRGTLTVSWSAPTTGATVTSYEYRYKKTAAANWTAWITRALNRTATISGLAGATAYDVQVRAVAAGGEGPSGSLSKTTLAVVPAAVSSLAATSTEDVVDVTWGAPASGAPVVRYEYRSKKGNAAFGEWTSVGTSRFVVLRGLDSATDYTVEVRPVAVGGEGPSESVTATTKTPPAPTKPGPIRSVSSSSTTTSITVEWSTPDTGAPVVRYEYRYKKGSGSFGSWSSVGTTRYVTIRGLVTSQSYTVEVRAVATENGDSESVTVTTKAPLKPANVSGLAATATDTTITLTWSAAARATSYQYRYKLGSASDWQPATSTGTARTVTVKGLSTGTAYNFQVRGLSSAGEGNWASVDASTTIAAEPVLLYLALSRRELITHNTQYGSDTESRRILTVGWAASARGEYDVHIDPQIADYSALSQLWTWRTQGRRVLRSDLGGTTVEQRVSGGYTNEPFRRIAVRIRNSATSSKAVGNWSDWAYTDEYYEHSGASRVDF